MRALNTNRDGRPENLPTTDEAEKIVTQKSVSVKDFKQKDGHFSKT